MSNNEWNFDDVELNFEDNSTSFDEETEQVSFTNLDDKLFVESKKKKTIDNKKILNALKTTGIILVLIVFILLIFLFIRNIIVPASNYHFANQAYSNGEYNKAIDLYKKLDDYKDSKEKLIESKYKYGCELCKSGDFENSYSIFNALIYQDTSNVDYKRYYVYSGYNYAKLLYDSNDFESSVNVISNISKFNNADETDDLYIDSKKFDDLKSNSYYSLFLETYNNKDYKTALSYFAGCNKSKEDRKYQECLLKLVLEYINDGDYREAENKIKDLSLSKKQKQSIYSAKYSYIKNHYTDEDYSTYAFLKDLKKANYKDSKELYRKLYRIEVSVKFNESEDDTSTSYSSISKYSTIYCHLTRHGGAPTSSSKVKCKFIWPNGNVNYVNTEFSIFGDEECVYFWYTEPYYGDTGTARLNIYDEAGELVGSSTVTLTN